MTKVNGQAVTPDQTLSYLIANVKPGSTARLDVVRDGKPISLSIMPIVRPSEEALAATLSGDDDSGGFGGGNDDDDGDTAAGTPAASADLGLTVQPLTPGIARALNADQSTQGVVIGAVAPTSDAAGKLQRGDIIQSVNSTPVRTAADVAGAVAAAKRAGRAQVLLLVKRGKGNPAFLPVKLKG